MLDFQTLEKITKRSQPGTSRPPGQLYCRLSVTIYVGVNIKLTISQKLVHRFSNSFQFCDQLQNVYNDNLLIYSGLIYMVDPPCATWMSARGI
jgi:hypothetical protein